MFFNTYLLHFLNKNWLLKSQFFYEKQIFSKKKPCPPGKMGSSPGSYNTTLILAHYNSSHLSCSVPRLTFCLVKKIIVSLFLAFWKRLTICLFCLCQKARGKPTTTCNDLNYMSEHSFAKQLSVPARWEAWSVVWRASSPAVVTARPRSLNTHLACCSAALQYHRKRTSEEERHRGGARGRQPNLAGIR